MSRSRDDTREAPPASRKARKLDSRTRPAATSASCKTTETQTGGNWYHPARPHSRTPRLPISRPRRPGCKQTADQQWCARRVAGAHPSIRWPLYYGACSVHWLRHAAPTNPFAWVMRRGHVREYGENAAGQSPHLRRPQRRQLDRLVRRGARQRRAARPRDRHVALAQPAGRRLQPRQLQQGGGERPAPG